MSKLDAAGARRITGKYAVLQKQQPSWAAFRVAGRFGLRGWCNPGQPTPDGVAFRAGMRRVEFDAKDKQDWHLPALPPRKRYY
jgi:hypothetical protein